MPKSTQMNIIIVMSKCRGKPNRKFLQFKLPVESDPKTNILQKPFSIKFYWFDLNKSAKLFST